VFQHNTKDVDDIFCSLSKSELVKVVHFKLEREIWDKIQNIYEGNDKVRMENIQTHRRQFESLKMKDEENVVAYILCEDEIFNLIRGFGEIVEESMIVQNMLRMLPLIFDAKVSAIEEMKDLEKF
jgi:hypothetical protein